MANSSFKKLINSSQPILIDFFATWCGPCTAFIPTLKDVKEELGDKVRIIKIDIDKNNELATALGVRSVPTVHVYQNGDLKWSAVGGQSKQTLVQAIERLG